MGILKPIAAAIAKIEGDGAILSDIQCLFADLKEDIQTVLPTSLLLKAEETAVARKASGVLHEAVACSSAHAGPKYDRDLLSGEEMNSDVF